MQPSSIATPTLAPAPAASIPETSAAAVSSSPAPPDPAIDQPADDNPDIVEADFDWQAFVPTDTADHLATMDRAARDSGCGVPWHLLAAIARVESDFGRNMATSSAGAVGYGQFLPSSWQSFGNDGNVYDYRDALPAIASYLCQSGLEADPRAALFAYNHAEWYVDLVLDLAVRYDRMAPGAPTPAVLDVAPAAESGAHLHYAAGRDVRRESRRRTVEGQADWLGVPWRGRAPGASISVASLEDTATAMLHAAFGLTDDAPPPNDTAADGAAGYAQRAWAAGLLAVPVEPRVLLPVPDELRPDQNTRWSIGEIRRDIERGQPLVAFVSARLLPGHAPDEAIGYEPLVLLGTTSTGVIYSDPSFSSSLGYGLELSDAQLLAALQAASTPGQTLAFAVQPAPPARDAHVHTAEPPPANALVMRAPNPPTPEATPVPLPIVLPTSSPTEPEPTLASIAPAPPASAEAVPASAAPEDPRDRSWLILVGAGAALLASLALTWVRARRY